MPQQNPNAATDYGINQPSVPPAGMQLLITIPAGNTAIVPNSSITGRTRAGGYSIQNQSLGLAYVVFDNGLGGNLSIMSIAAATVVGGQGGQLVSGEAPFTGRIRIYGADPAQQIDVRVW